MALPSTLGYNLRYRDRLARRAGPVIRLTAAKSWPCPAPWGTIFGTGIAHTIFIRRLLQKSAGGCHAPKATCLSRSIDCSIIPSRGCSQPTSLAPSTSPKRLSDEHVRTDENQRELEEFERLFGTSETDESLAPGVDDDEPEQKRLAYVKCKEQQAETVLVLRITIPKVMTNWERRFPLRLRNIGPSYDSGISSSFSDGLAADGTLFGSSCFTMLKDATSESVNLAIRMNWTAEDRTSGSFGELLPIAIGVSSAKELAEGIRLEWEFEGPNGANGR